MSMHVRWRHAVKPSRTADVEEHARLLEGDGLLGARNAGEAVVPLEEEAGLPVRGVEPPLHEVQLVVVLEQQRDPVPVPARCPHRLHQQSVDRAPQFLHQHDIDLHNIAPTRITLKMAIQRSFVLKLELLSAKDHH